MLLILWRAIEVVVGCGAVYYFWRGWNEYQIVLSWTRPNQKMSDSYKVRR